MKYSRLIGTVVIPALCAGLVAQEKDAPAGKALAWIRFEKAAERYSGTPYIFLGFQQIGLDIAAKPRAGLALDLLWGSKNDSRTAVVVINGKSQPVVSGGYDGFRWKRVTLPADLEGDRCKVTIKQGGDKAAFIAEVRLTDPAGQTTASATRGASHNVTLSTTPVRGRPATASTPPLVSGKEILARLPTDPLERSAAIAGYSLSKVQRWLHEVALKKIDPKTKLYISHPRGSGRYRSSLWNYDDAAADTYPFLFWAAWYTDHDQIHGPILEVLEAEQRICNHLDRIPTAVHHQTLKKDIKSKDSLIFAASEYVKDGLIAIIEVAGKENPWFDRMRAIEDDIWKNADIDTAYGKIPTTNLEANGEQIQALARLFTSTGDKKYLEWAERLADHYLLPGDFLPTRLRDHGCEIIGGLGLLLGVESVHNPEKAKVYLPLIRKMLDTILERGTNEDGMMFNRFGGGGLSDGWGYNYVTYLCHDIVVGEPRYPEHLRRTLRNLSKPKYTNYLWEGRSIDGYADSIEGGLYILNRLPVPEGLTWVDQEMAANVTRMADPLPTAKLWSTYKLDSNGVRTVLMHALMHTRGLIARPWRQGLALGASQTEEGVRVFLKSERAYQGRLIFDIPRHREQMGFKRDWPRMNTMPEWYTVEPGEQYVVKNVASGSEQKFSGKQLHEGLPVQLQAGQPQLLLVRRAH